MAGGFSATTARGGASGRSNVSHQGLIVLFSRGHRPRSIVLLSCPGSSFRRKTRRIPSFCLYIGYFICVNMFEENHKEVAMVYGDAQGERAYKERMDAALIDSLSDLKMQLYENTLPGKLIRIPYLESMRDCLATFSFDEVRELDKITGAMSGPYNANICYNIVLSMLSYDPAWLKGRVDHNGPWDYKRVMPGKFEEFGNFHYGAVFAAFGVPENIALRGAGWAQEDHTPDRHGPGHWYSFAPYGDFENDQEAIKKGYAFFNKFKILLYGGLQDYCRDRN